MFFPRLRNHAKWMFVFLALVFGVGFVAFGVGSSLPSGVADILKGTSSSGTASVSDAQNRVEKNPQDAQAQHDLSRAYQRDRNIDAAIPPLQKYTQLRPKDTSALQELAALYTTQASRAQDEAALAQTQYSAASGISPFLGTEASQLFTTGALDKLIVDDAQKRAQDAQAKIGKAYGEAATTYGKLVKLTPKDAELWYLYALSAESAAKYPLALRGYQQFLKLSPDATEATFVKQKIKSLKQSGQQTVVGGSGVTTITR